MSRVTCLRSHWSNVWRSVLCVLISRSGTRKWGGVKIQIFYGDFWRIYIYNMIKSFDKIYSIREMNGSTLLQDLWAQQKKRSLKNSGKDVASFLAFWWGIWIQWTKKGTFYQQKKTPANVIVTFISTCQVAERTLFLWNNDYIVRLITSSRKVAADRTTDRTATKWWFEWKISIRGVSWNEGIPTCVKALFIMFWIVLAYIQMYIKICIDALYEQCIWIYQITTTCTNGMYL